MVTYKLRAIWKVIRADHLMLFSKRGEGKVDGFGFGQGGLEDIMLMAVELKKSYDNMQTMIGQAATESGELHALEALKKTLDTEIPNVSEE